MLGDLPLLLKIFVEVVGVQRVLIEAKPPTCMAEDNAINTLAHAEIPVVRSVMRKDALHAIILAGALDDFEIRVQSEHLKMHAGNPETAHPHFAIGNRLQMRP